VDILAYRSAARQLDNHQRGKPVAYRKTSDLPTDEGTVFVTLVPNAAFQVLGRRADNGELCFGRMLLDPPQIIEELGKKFEFEIVTGEEAEELIADLRASTGRDAETLVADAFAVRRRR
jgi:hypothetical protein